MDKRLLMLFLTVVGSSLIFACPANVNECMVGTIPSFGGNTDLLCTSVLSQTLSAIHCFEDCRVPPPKQLIDVVALINVQCTAKEGCRDIVAMFAGLNRCFDGLGGLAGVSAQIIEEFNDQKQYQTSCQFLRTGLNCQATAMQKCAYLATVLKQQRDETPKYRSAVSICGSENVPKAPQKTLCSVDVLTSVEQKCGVACPIAVADSSEALCEALQRQSDCIVEESGSCTGSLEMYLQPRLDTYAIVNDFLKCNISVDGIVVKPTHYTDRENCDYRRVLKGCLNVDTLDSVHYIFLRNLLNLDFPLFEFCRPDFNLTSQAQKCDRSLWGCSLPVGRTFKTPTSFDGSSFQPGLGAFPLNRWGLQSIVQSCPYSPVEPTVLCKRSTPPPGMWTKNYQNKRTPPVIFKRPTPSRSPNNL